MHIMSFEEFLENGKPEMSVIIQRVADRYKKNYKNTLKRQHVPEHQYKNLCQKSWKGFRKTKDFDAAGQLLGYRITEHAEMYGSVICST